MSLVFIRSSQQMVALRAYVAAVTILTPSAYFATPPTKENLRRIRASLTAYHGRTGPQPLGD